LAKARTKEEALQYMRILWFNMIAAIVLYIYTGETMPLSWFSFHHSGKIFAALAALNLVSFAWCLWKRYSPALQALQSEPENVRAVKRWATMWMILLCSADSIAFFGVAFRMGGKTLEQTLPFYVVGSILTLWLWPRRFWSSARTSVQ
jgi:hypothetical protein